MLGEWAQWLKILAAVLKDQSLFLSTHVWLLTTVCDKIYRSDVLGFQVSMSHYISMHSLTHKQTHTYTIDIIKNGRKTENVLLSFLWLWYHPDKQTQGRKHLFCLTSSNYNSLLQGSCGGRNVYYSQVQRENEWKHAHLLSCFCSAESLHPFMVQNILIGNGATHGGMSHSTSVTTRQSCLLRCDHRPTQCRQSPSEILF